MCKKYIKTNHIKIQILPILDEIIAYLRGKSCFSNKSTQKKFHFPATSGKKSVKFEDFQQNNWVFMTYTLGIYVAIAKN